MKIIGFVIIKGNIAKSLKRFIDDAAISLSLILKITVPNPIATYYDAYSENNPSIKSKICVTKLFLYSKYWWYTIYVRKYIAVFR